MLYPLHIPEPTKAKVLYSWHFNITGTMGGDPTPRGRPKCCTLCFVPKVCTYHGLKPSYEYICIYIHIHIYMNMYVCVCIHT